MEEEDSRLPEDRMEVLSSETLTPEQSREGLRDHLKPTETRTGKQRPAKRRDGTEGLTPIRRGLLDVMGLSGNIKVFPEEG